MVGSECALECKEGLPAPCRNCGGMEVPGPFWGSKKSLSKKGIEHEDRLTNRALSSVQRQKSAGV